MDFRHASEADIAAEREVFVAALGELMRRHAFPAPDPPLERFAAIQRHLLAEDGERCFVAEEDGRVVGFCAAVARADTWFLSALFVHPEAQARKVGRRLLELCWGAGFSRRLTITDSIQPVSNGLYARLGLIPSTPIVALEGEARGDVPAGLEATEPQAAALAALDRAAYGFDRAPDHRFWSGRSRGTLWLRGGEPVAYSYAADAGMIGPIAARGPEDAADALRAELARREGRSAEVEIPGSAREVVAAVLEAGLRFVAPPGFLLLSSGIEPPRALAISGYWLF